MSRARNYSPPCMMARSWVRRHLQRMLAAKPTTAAAMISVALQVGRDYGDCVAEYECSLRGNVRNSQLQTASVSDNRISFG